MAIEDLLHQQKYNQSAPSNTPSNTNTINNQINQATYNANTANNKKLADKIYNISATLENTIYESNKSMREALEDKIYKSGLATQKAIEASVYDMLKKMTYKPKATPTIGSSGDSFLGGPSLLKELNKAITYKNSFSYPSVEPLDVWNNTEDINKEYDEKNISEQKIDSKFFGAKLEYQDRRKQIKEFSFEYLAYLFFKSDINIELNEFYAAVTNKINNKDFFNETDDNSDMDEYLIHYVFNQIWTEALKTGSFAVRNVVGFYIYFNKELNFFDILIQGDSINDFLNNMTLNGILDIITSLGLYPLNIGNLFNRLWYSYKFSATEGGNKAEVIMSINEFYKYNLNRLSSNVFHGFNVKKDKLNITTSICPKSQQNKNRFNSTAAAFNALINLDYGHKLDLENPIDAFLSKRIPINEEIHIKDFIKTKETRPLVFKNKSVFKMFEDTEDDLYNLWKLLESFDNDYKINVSYINKRNIEKLFIKFSQDKSFPLDNEIVDINNNHIQFWVYWLEFLNAYANNLNVYNYDSIFEYLIELSNIRFVIIYLNNNNAFKDYIFNETEENWNPGDVDGYILAKFQEIYQSLDTLKNRLKNILKAITITDKRFYLI